MRKKVRTGFLGLQIITGRQEENDALGRYAWIYSKFKKKIIYILIRYDG
jgi:hypothetical protein